MPFFDKVKEQASQVAAKASEAGKAGQAKIEGAQAKRDLDALFRRLGAAVHAHHIGESEGAEDVGELHTAISAHEAEHPAEEATAAPAASSVGADGVGASFTLSDDPAPAAPASDGGGEESSAAPSESDEEPAASAPSGDAPAGDFKL